MKLRVWWIPQVPSERQFIVPVKSVHEGVLIMDTLAMYDQYQLDNNIKPDYSNAGGLEMLDEDGDWVSWMDDETGEDDPHFFLIDGA